MRVVLQPELQRAAPGIDIRTPIESTQQIHEKGLVESLHIPMALGIGLLTMDEERTEIGDHGQGVFRNKPRTMIEIDDRHETVFLDALE